LEPLAVGGLDAGGGLVGDEVHVHPGAVGRQPLPAPADPGGGGPACGGGGGTGGGEAEVEADLALADGGGLWVDPADRPAHDPAVDLRERRGDGGDLVEEGVDDRVGGAGQAVR